MSPGHSKFIGLAVIMAAVLPASAATKKKDHFWKPYRVKYSYYSTYVPPVQFGFKSETDPWVQQMRNFRDVLRVDAYRGDPTPTPTPTPTPAPTPPGGTTTFTISNANPIVFSGSFINGTTDEEFDPTPPHPLDDYFDDVAAIYDDAGYRKIANVLKHAGIVVEDLITARGKKRFRAARVLAQELEAAVAASSDQPMIDEALSLGPGQLMLLAYGEDTITTYYWDDYRSIAWNLAKSLRQAAKNAASSRALARDIPYLPKELIVTLAETIYWNSAGSRLDLSRSDGNGGTTTANLSDMTKNYTGSYYGGSYASGVTFTNFSSGSDASFSFSGEGLTGESPISVSFSTPTPTPTP